MRLGRARLAVAVAGVLAAASANAAGGSPRVPPTVDHFGVWPLSRLGYGDITLRPAVRTGRAERTVRFSIPRALARQGPRNWWLIHLHYEIVLRRSPIAPVDINVAVDANGYATASTDLTLRRLGGEFLLTSDDVGLVGGHVRSSTRARRKEIRYANYLQTSGVRAGVNTLSFAVSENAGPTIDRVTVFRDTALELSRLGPPTIRLLLNVRERRPRAGRAFHVDYTLLLRSGHVVPSAALKLTAGSRRQARSQRWGSREPLVGAFAVPAREPGIVTVRLTAAAGLERTRALTAVRVAPEATPWRRIVFLVAVAVIPVAAVAAVIRRRLRRN